MSLTATIENELREKDERLRLALSASGLGMWEMDLVHNTRHWSDETFAIHGIQRTPDTQEHIELNNNLMHPEDRSRLTVLHKELQEGLDDYAFEYRTTWPTGEVRWISARGKVLERDRRGPTRIVGVSADITAQKKERLHREHIDLQLRLLADSLPQLVWIADGRGHINYYNARRVLYFNESEGQSQKLQWQPLIHPEDLPQTVSGWSKALQSGEDYDMEHRLRMADGSYCWHLSRATAVKGADGKLVAWFGTATDIDRVKLAEVQIEASVERLKVATEAASMFAWDFDFRTNQLNWADNAASTIGCPQELFSGPNFDGAFFVHPDDRQKLRDDFDGFVQSGAEHFEMDFRGLPEAHKPVFWRAAGKILRDGAGQPLRAVGVTQNVSRHVEATERLKLLDERLATAEEGARALVYDWDRVTNHVWRSDSLKRILGWDFQEVGPDAQSWANLMHPDDLAIVNARETNDWLDEDDHYIMEYRIRHKDGAYRWMMDSGRVFRNAAGEITRQAGTSIDITARKSMEMSQQRMLRLIDLSFEPIFVWQTDQGILEWNRGAEILYGFSRDEALGKHPGDLLQTHYPLPFGQLVTQLQNAKHWSGEVENVDKLGNVIAVETRYQIITYDNETVVLETNRDLRERKLADTHGARLAAVAAASHDALYGATLAGIIEAWNPGAVALMGYTENEAIGQNISMLAFPEQHDEQLGFLHKVSLGESVPPFDTVRRAKDGRTLQVSMAMSPVKAANGTVVGISVALHDISERKEWDRQQRLMNKELAHRVKNSFAVLQAILHSTLRTSPEPQKFTSAFSSRLHSMAAAHDVLTANDWRGAELRALLQQLLLHQVNSYRVSITGPSVHLPLEYTAPLSLIFNELLTNALKYGALSSSEGTIDISWTVQNSDEGVPLVALQWRETGGPPISAVGPPGFGTTLIKRSLADANVTLEFKEEGLLCQMTWPILPPRQPAV